MDTGHDSKRSECVHDVSLNLLQRKECAISGIQFLDQLKRWQRMLPRIIYG